MTGKMPRGWIVAAVLAAGVAVGLPQTAEAQRHGGGHRGGAVVVRGVYGFPGFYGYPYFGFGFGYPFWSMYGPYPPAFYAPEGGLDRGLALVSGFGGIDLDVKPGQAEVWVDGAKAATIDLYSATVRTRRVVFVKGWGSSTSHTVELRVLGIRNPASTGNAVWLDAFATMS